ncbi:MAG: hypothetical protein ACOX9E_10360 [Lentisphaeria bacterium]|jgi:tetrahydromethanopterin S-methyltransferase subunit G
MKASIQNFLLKLSLTVALVAPLLCVCQPLNERNQTEDRGAGIRPEKRPNKPNDNELTAARKNAKYKEFFDAYDEIIALYRERDALEAANDPKEARKAQSKLERVDRKLDRAKRDFYKIAEKLRKPLDKDYEKLQARLDDLNKKAEDAEARNQDDRATKFYQEQAKYTGPHANLKRQIDLIDYHLFFDDDETEGLAGGRKDEIQFEEKGDGKRERGPKKPRRPQGPQGPRGPGRR